MESKYQKYPTQHPESTNLIPVTNTASRDASSTRYASPIPKGLYWTFPFSHFSLSSLLSSFKKRFKLSLVMIGATPSPLPESRSTGFLGWWALAFGLGVQVLVCGQRSGSPVPSGLDWLVVGCFLFTAQLAKGN